MLDTDIGGNKRFFIMGHSSRGERSRFWKNGRYMHGEYIMLRAPNYPGVRRGYIFEHILIYETFNKCSLVPWAVIHHRDGNKQNNHISSHTKDR